MDDNIPTTIASISWIGKGFAEFPVFYTRRVVLSLVLNQERKRFVIVVPNFPVLILTSSTKELASGKVRIATNRAVGRGRVSRHI